MPVTPTFPGVYIQEIPSGVRTIASVPTSIAAFVDFFRRGPMNEATEILSLADFQRIFGGLDQRSEASYAIQQFFLNGGTQAYVVRVAAPGSGAGALARAGVVSQSDLGGATALVIRAANEGAWGNNLRVGVEHVTGSPDFRFNLTVSEVDTLNGQVVVLNQEVFRNLSVSANLPSPPAPANTPDPNYIIRVVNGPNGSRLVRVDDPPGSNRPQATGTLADTFAAVAAQAGGRAVTVTFTTPAGSLAGTANIGATAIASIDEAAARLEAGIRNAHPERPAWAQATVRAANGRLQIVAGPSAPDAIITFANVSPGDTSADALKLTGANVKANVAYYRLGFTGAGMGAEAPTSPASPGGDGDPPTGTELIGSAAAVPPTGLFALDQVDLFNILCLPRIARLTPPNAFPSGAVNTVISTATTYCEGRRAFLILDTPSNVTTIAGIKTWLAGLGTLRHRNVALYFPRVQHADPLDNFRLRSFGASGTMAGVFARTDVERGVWKAPAGTEAVLRNVQLFDYKMSDAENGTINPLAINALRAFDIYGNVSWGARTLVGSDQQASEWKYVPVRRLALFIEESLYRGTKWAVFEPNDEPLWAQLRLNVGAFMHDLFRQGAFQGSTPREAYLVKCDRETTTQNDINLGIVNVLVGFAPLKPAEFVIINIQQLAGQIQV